MPKRPRALAACLFAATVIGPRSVDATTVSLVEVAGALDRPTALANAGDGSGRLFITEKPGRIRVFSDGRLAAEPFLSIVGRVKSNLFEQGLVGLAFHPDFESNGLFFVAYTSLDGDSVLSRFSIDGETGAGDPMSETPLLTVEQPDAIHNVNQLAFGPDGYLYVTSGDGGPGMDPFDTAQDLGTLLGKILRIDVDGGPPYAIPPDNPFVGVPGAREEIWAYGLRNPARLSFDRATGDLYMSDVGQGSWEEIDREPANDHGGRNYGWSLMEGNHCFDPPTDCDPGGLTPPIVEYANAGADCAAMGGYVYRGTRQPELAGIYLYGDFCSGRIRGADAGCGGWAEQLLVDAPFQISAFGETEAGELMVVEWAHETARLYAVTAEAGTAIFQDGFESGHLGAWDECLLGPGGRS